MTLPVLFYSTNHRCLNRASQKPAKNSSLFCFCEIILAKLAGNGLVVNSCGKLFLASIKLYSTQLSYCKGTALGKWRSSDGLYRHATGVERDQTCISAFEDDMKTHRVAYRNALRVVPIFSTFSNDVSGAVSAKNVEEDAELGRKTYRSTGGMYFSVHGR